MSSGDQGKKDGSSATYKEDRRHLMVATNGNRRGKKKANIRTHLNDEENFCKSSSANVGQRLKPLM
jgi:hypothetical protein